MRNVLGIVPINSYELTAKAAFNEVRFGMASDLTDN